MDKGVLIYKVLSQTVSETEKKELNDWIAKSPGNMSDYEDMKFLMENVKDPGESIATNKHFYDGLQKIKRMIRALEAKE